VPVFQSPLTIMNCLFCGSQSLHLLYSGNFHPVAVWHGPFDFYRCNTCGSGLTQPLPEPGQLVKLYESFEGGMIPRIRALRDKYPLTTWFHQCINKALKYSGKVVSKESPFNWIDLGAGNGELAILLANRFPNSNGIAVDFQGRPGGLDLYPDVKWIKTDLNQDELRKHFTDTKPDLAFSITVLEHLIHPEHFIENALDILGNPGCLYLTSPRIDCNAFHLLGKKWPYFLPGEHLNIPSLKGMRSMLERICKEKFEPGTWTVYIKPVVLPYPLGYYAKYLKLGEIGDMIPGNWVLRFPTGMLEAAVILSGKSYRTN
jgi:hypothetical protein